MTRLIDKEKAIKFRQKGMSYSQIKEKLNLSKSTLSNWLSDFPLSKVRIRELRDKNPKRIERFRDTMKKKRDCRLDEVYEKLKKDVGKLSKREIFLCGLFLYWGEGLKASNYTTSVSNTDPHVLKFFIKWLNVVGIKKSQTKIKLHLYKDMDEKKEKIFWSKTLQIPLKNFSKTYIKKSNLLDLSYKKGYGHGTCNVSVYNRDLTEYILMGLKYIKEISGK